MRKTIGLEHSVSNEIITSTMSASEAIAKNEEALKTFILFQELASPDFWPGHARNRFRHSELSGATESGKLFHLWRGSRRSDDHTNDFLLVVGDVHTSMIEEAVITHAVETKDGNGAALHMQFYIPEVEAMSACWLRLSQRECVLGTIADGSVEHEEDHIMDLSGMKHAVGRWKKDGRALR